MEMSPSSSTSPIRENSSWNFLRGGVRPSYSRVGELRRNNEDLPILVRRVAIASAAALEGAHARIRMLRFSDQSCRIASTIVVVFPVPKLRHNSLSQRANHHAQRQCLRAIDYERRTPRCHFQDPIDCRRLRPITAYMPIERGEPRKRQAWRGTFEEAPSRKENPFAVGDV